MSLRINISDISLHGAAARELLNFAETHRIMAFEAPMGSGKTTFIKEICRQLGVAGSMSSPTYAIVNEYITNSGQKVFHFDLYRLKSSLELFDIGFEEYISSGAYVFIEWPEVAFPFINSYIKVTIESNKNIRYLCAEIISEL